MDKIRGNTVTLVCLVTGTKRQASMRNIKLYKAEGITRDQSPNAGKIFPITQEHDKYLDSDLTFTDVTDISDQLDTNKVISQAHTAQNQNNHISDTSMAIQTRSRSKKDQNNTRQKDEGNTCTTHSKTLNKQKHSGLVTGTTSADIHTDNTIKHGYNLRKRT